MLAYGKVLLMINIKDIINKRAKELTVESSRSELQVIQEEINRFFKKDLVAAKLHPNGTLVLNAANAAVAASTRLKQRQIVQSIETALPGIVEKLYIKIV